MERMPARHHQCSGNVLRTFLILVFFSVMLFFWMISTVPASFAQSGDAAVLGPRNGQGCREETGDQDGGAGRSGTIFVPFPIYTPETEFAVTLTVMHHRRSETQGRPSTVMGFLAYSQLNQFRAAATGDSQLAGGRLHATGSLSFADWPDRFYGIGTDNTRREEEDFTERSVDVRLALQHRLTKNLKAGAVVSFRNYEIEDTEPGGLLDTGDVPGAGGGTVFGAGPVVTHDSRDDSFFPRKGYYTRFSVLFFPDGPGDYRFQQYRGDMRWYVPAGEAGVVAFRQYVNIMRGDVPFSYLSKIGDTGNGGLLRGYSKGLFRERDLAALQIEYRAPVWKRLGAAVFGGAGVIGEDLLSGKDLAVKPAGGFGLRYRVGKEETINLRLDFALGEGSSGVYFSFLEAF